MQRKLYFLVLWAALFLFTPPTSHAQSQRTSSTFNRSTAIERLVAKARQQVNDVPGLYLKTSKPSKLLTNQLSRPLTTTSWKKTSAQPLLTVDNGVTLWGNVIYASNWEASAYGIYSFQAAQNPTIASVATSSLMSATGGGVFIDNEYHFVSVNRIGGNNLDIRSYTWDIDKNEYLTHYENTSCPSNMMALSTALDPTSGVVYGCYYTPDRTAFEFGTADYTKFTRTTITHLGSDKAYVAMAVSKDGTLFAIREDGNLYKIDKQNGAETLIGSTGVSVYPNMQSACFDYHTGKLYWNARRNDGTAVTSALYEVDTTTGAATLLGDFANGEMIPAMFVKYQPADRAPGKAENLTLVYDEGATDGIIGFDVPDKCADGKSSLGLFGNVNYYVIANNDTIARGTTKSKETVSVDAKLPNGWNRIKVVLSNRYGEGEAALAEQWVGPDVPRHVTSANATVDDAGKASITWTAPKRGINNGYMDQIYYRVTRYPDSLVVADKLTTTSATDQLPTSELKSYYYGITPYTTGGDGKEENTTFVTVGQYVNVPYYEGFDNAGQYNLYSFPKKSTNVNNWQYNFNEQCASYNSGDDTADDWMMTPPIKLAADHEYSFSFRAHTRELLDITFAHKLQAGFAATTLDGTVSPAEYEIILDTTTVQSADWVTYKATVRPKAGNDYYRFGIHEVSSPNNWLVYVDDIRVEAGASFAAPDSVKSLYVTVGARGAKTATVNFTAPTTTINGQNLYSIDSVRIYRDGKFIHTITGVTPGSRQRYTDNVPASGSYTYRVVAYNAQGMGSAAETSAWVGFDTPFAPSNVNLTDNYDGTASLKWTFTSQNGIHGGYVNPLATYFNIYKYDNGSWERYRNDSILGRETTVDAPLDGDQAVLYHAVTAVNEAGESDASISNSIITGMSYNLPFKESFTGGALDNKFWTVNRDGQLGWNLTSQLASDDDRGSTYFIPAAAGDRAILETGKISPAGAAKLKLTFDYFAIKGDMQLNVYAEQPGNLVTGLKGINFTEETSTTGEWKKVVLDLDKFLDSDWIRIRFLGASNETQLPILIDNVSVRDVLSKDLSASIAVPNRVTAGQPATMNVRVENLGEENANNFSIDLYIDGKKVASRSGLSLNAYAAANYTFDQAVDVQTKDNAKVYAVVNYDGDLDTDNNTTQTETMDVKEPTLVAVNDLKIDNGATAGSAKLSWSAPANTAQSVTDDFEDYTPFITDNIGEWKTVDLDSAEVYFFQDITYPFSSNSMAFGVFNPSADGVDVSQVPSLKPHSGNQYLVALGAEPNSAKNGQNDDWLISPRLSGDAQTISFYAKSCNDQYGLEDFEVLYSTTGDSVADFTHTVSAANTQATTEWTLFQYELPADAKYFAIHSISKDKFILMIDDISYLSEKRAIEGYRIYQDGQLLTTVTEPSATVNAEGNHTYFVTVVYKNQGESLPSNTVSLTTGINEINSAVVNIYTTGEALHVDHADGRNVAVYTVDGKTIYSGKVNGSATIALHPGLYIVKAGEVNVHVLIK